MKLTPELKAAIQAQLPEIEQKTEQLWIELKRLETEMEPYKTRLDKATRLWSIAYNEREQLVSMLAQEATA